MGFSNGAWAAAETALAQPGEWQQLVLIAMKVSLDAAKLRGAGIERVVLAAGDHDGSAHSMQSEAKKLNAAGLPALYLSLGKVGHTFPRDMASRMETALQWLETPQNQGDQRVTKN
jgi:predicted esterase